MHSFARSSSLFIVALSFLFLSQTLLGQTVAIGSGSYTTNFPGTDQAGRNGFPSGTPQLSGNALGKPVPTNDWWSKLIKENHADNLFTYPMTLKTVNSGLIVTYIPWGVIGDSQPIVIGLTGLNASRTTVSDYSDWTVTMDWNDGNRNLSATAGIGMPFLYFQKDAGSQLAITVNAGTATMTNELLIIENAASGADFVFYAPAGSTWTKSGAVYSSTLNGQTYWSMAMLPQSSTNVAAIAEEYKQYAYVFPTNTTASWNFDEATSVMRTDFTVETETKEGTATDILQGLLPHQWAHLSADSPAPDRYTYASVRGELRTMAGNNFSVENTFRGILPTLPYLANYSEEFSPATMNAKNAQIENDGLATWTDSYNEGQVMNRLIQTARIADQIGNIAARDKMIATIKERLEDWLTYQASEVAFLFYYNSAWSTLIGYPAGHGQDNNINDHHFHWGYFIHAAAFLEQFEPGWANQWGEMINHLVRDAASPDRNDTKFPFLRNFSPYAGHCWANGFATFPQGNDQESTSESMQFNSSLIHWGTITGNDEIRDLGIYLYTTEQTAIDEYWLDVYERNFGPNQQYSLVSRVWGNSYDNGTFWTSDITASYGIELYPMHGGSFYLGEHPTYVEKLWNEIESNTGILSSEDTNPNLWHDVFWSFLALKDPQKAIQLYNGYPDRILKFGISDAQTYHWLHGMNALGTLRNDLTADYPIALAFEKEGTTTYVAHNYSDSPLIVTFSDGFELAVPAGRIATSRDVEVSGILASDFAQAYPGGSVNLIANISGEGVTKVAFYDGNLFLGELIEAPYAWRANNLTLGMHGLYAKVYVGDAFNVTNIVSVQVGEQVPYGGNVSVIPGLIEAGHYDAFEGGIGQGITYVDVSQNNEGGFRPEEFVDAAPVTNEGATIGWIASGEWVEYTVDVATAGVYNVAMRYASGNAAGGGPMYFEVDGARVSENVSFNSTSPTNWNTWVNKNASVELNKGRHVLRAVFVNGEFNLGKMTFTRTGDLPYLPPVAHAGSNVTVVLPTTTAQLDGSGTENPGAATLTYEWMQVYGPSIIEFSDVNAVSPGISNLEDGIYKCKLTVSDGTYSSSSDVLVIVSETGNTPPTVAITSPANNATFKQGEVITITASTSDLDGQVVRVEFYEDGNKIGEDTGAPFSFSWNNAPIGTHVLTAKAIDDLNGENISAAVSVTVSEVKACTETSNQASQGSFSTGYTATFETVGNTVTVTFQLLDTDKSGVVAFLWQQSPFTEFSMNALGNNTFSRTLTGQTIGSTISYACKFAFAGGLSATKYISYEVGSSCMSLSLADAVWTIPENSANGTVIGTPASNYGGNGTLTYAILNGNSTGAFQINTTTGQLSVAESAKLDYETIPSFQLTIRVTDGTLSDQSSVTIHLSDVDETILSADDEWIQKLVYPNPVRTQLSIDWVDLDQVTLYDISGKPILVSSDSKIDIRHLPDGVYFLRLSGINNELMHVRILKH
jgi:endoglucanase Acf2